MTLTLEGTGRASYERHVRSSFLVGLLGVCVMASGCGQFERARECRELADVVNPALREIAELRSEPKRRRAPSTYDEIATRYTKLGDQIITLGFTDDFLSRDVKQYAEVFRAAGNANRKVAEALSGRDTAKLEAVHNELVNLKQTQENFGLKLRARCAGS